MRIDALLERSASRWPEKVAIVFGSERRSYGQLNEQANRIARALIDGGVCPGDRVVIDLGNSADAVVSIFAVLKAGGVFVLAHPHARPGHVKHLLDDSGARLLVGSTTFRELAAGRQSTEEPLPRHGDADLAALIYTSGSTGRPKGVMLTHHNMTSAAASICSYLSLTEDDVILSALPLAFTYGLGQITTAFRSGATVVLERSMIYPRAVVESLAREGVTGLPLVPTMATLLLQQNLKPRQFPRLRYITSAAAALPAAKIAQLRDVFPGVEIYSMYGQTECQRVSYLPPDQLDKRPTSVGIPIPGTRAWVVDERGEAAAPGVIGELVVSGPHVMKGYWNQPAADYSVLHTGDFFRADADGFLHFVGRMDDMIKTRGEKVAPRAIEDVISALPGVADVVVYGVPDDVLGEAITAVVVPSPGASLSPERIQRHCLQRLDAFMVPKVVDIRDTLPTTMTGKVSRRTLRAMAIEAGKACA